MSFAVMASLDLSLKYRKVKVPSYHLFQLAYYHPYTPL